MKETAEKEQLAHGQCGGCRADYPHCDCALSGDEAQAAEADAREGQYTAWELL